MVLNLLDNNILLFLSTECLKIDKNYASQIPSVCQSNTIKNIKLCQSNTISLPVKYHQSASQIPSKTAFLPVKYHVSIEIYRTLYRVSIECLKKCFFRSHFLNTRIKFKSRTISLRISQYIILFLHYQKKLFLQTMSDMFSSHPLPPPKIEAVRPAR